MTTPADTSEPEGQLSLFGAGEDRMQATTTRFVPDPEVVRARLHNLLAMARGANVMPWPEHDARMWQTVFPQMANWLPDDEADQLRFAFVCEIERLKAA
jgi:hypothetical protein